MILKRSLLLLGLALLLATSATMAPRLVPEAHGALTGLVCLRDPSSSVANSGTPCNGSPSSTFDGPAPGSGQTSPTQIRIGVYTDGSDALDGFDITLLTNHTILRPVGVDLTGSVVPGTPTVITECLGGVNVTGPRCPTTDTIDTLHFAAVVLNLLTTAPTSGLLFAAIYNITGTVASTGISLGFQTGCISTSVNPICVTISNGTGIPDTETVQTGSFNNHTPPPWVALTTNTTSVAFLGGSSIGNHAGYVATAKNTWPGTSTDSISFSSATPSGLTASFSPSSCATGGGSCSIVLSLSGNAGNYSITVVGKYVLTDQSFPGQTDTLVVPFPLRVTIRDFGLSATPSALTLLALGSATSSIMLSSMNGFSGNVKLSVSCGSSSTISSTGGAGGGRFYEMVPPSSSSCPLTTLSSPSISLSVGGSSSSTLTVYALNVAGTYSFIVSAQSLPAVPKTQTISVTLLNFNITGTPTNAAILAGSSSGTSVLTLKSQNGFTGSVSLSSTVFPSGLVVSFSLSTLSLLSGGSASTVMSFSAPSGTATGAYVILVTAASGGISQTFSVGVTVEPPGWRFVLSRFLAQPGSSPLVLAGLVALIGAISSSGLMIFRARSRLEKSRERILHDLIVAKNR